MNLMNSRRGFLKKTILALIALCFGRKVLAQPVAVPRTGKVEGTVYRALNGGPAVNLQKVIDLIGGIEGIIGADDIVVIKPNVQWWNQGAPNLAALKTFVDLIMDRPGGFKGEVVVAENCHRGPTPWDSTSSGWAQPFEINSDLKGVNNFIDLCDHLKKRYDRRFSVSHWIDVDAGGKRVYSPEDGLGYVYCDGTGGVPLIAFDNGATGADRRSVIMSYPIFKTDRGTIVDFKNGIWEKGAYTGQPVKFINFAALNHHSGYCGVTSAIKNYLGISDISGGADPKNGGRLTGDYFNFHSFPFNKWSPGPEPGMLGAEIAVFMNTIRKADLNITTAEWIGLSSRTEPPISRTRAVLASKDPVALDYHATKYVLFPNSQIPVHNPDNLKGPLYHVLKRCADQSGFIFDETHVAVKSYDFQKQSMQDDRNLVVSGKIRWGYEPKILMKYMEMRFLGGA